jgi:hypothetical protein
MGVGLPASSIGRTGYFADNAGSDTIIALLHLFAVNKSASDKQFRRTGLALGFFVFRCVLGRNLARSTLELPAPGTWAYPGVGNAGVDDF